ncbi:hypothetical protein Q8F55_001725 [Vanrija albida]|uniref:Uncharacterized protein n=1 Tax=Vanrija albida TaxID=181172 RepID=A0ABR3Q7S0_9TREE
MPYAPTPATRAALNSNYLNIFTDGPPPPSTPPFVRRASGPKPGVVVPRLVSTDWPFSTRPTAAGAPASRALPPLDSPGDEFAVVTSPRSAGYGSPLPTATEVSEADAGDDDGDGATVAERTPVAERALLPWSPLQDDASAGFATLLALPALADPDLQTALHHLAGALEAFASAVAARRAGPHAAAEGLLLGRDGSILGAGVSARAPDGLEVVSPGTVHPAAISASAYTPAQRLLFLAASPALDTAWAPLVALVRALESTLDDATERGVIAELRAEFMGALRGAVAPPNSAASVASESDDPHPHPVVQYARVPSFPDIRH